MVTSQFWDYGETAGVRDVELALCFEEDKNDPRV